MRGTPLPLPVYLGAWLIGAGWSASLSVVLLFVVAVPALGVHVYADTLPQALLVLVLGAACLGSIGLALGTMAKTADQATPLAQLTMLPISFISGVWFPITDAPSWLMHLAGLLPAQAPGRRVLGLLRAGRERGRRRPRLAGDLGRGRDVRRGPPPAPVMDGARSRLIPSFR